MAPPLVPTVDVLCLPNKGSLCCFCLGFVGSVRGSVRRSSRFALRSRTRSFFLSFHLSWFRSHLRWFCLHGSLAVAYLAAFMGITHLWWAVGNCGFLLYHFIFLFFYLFFFFFACLFVPAANVHGVISHSLTIASTFVLFLVSSTFFVFCSVRDVRRSRHLLRGSVALSGG